MTAVYPVAQNQLVDPKNNSTTKLLDETEQQISENRLYIPKIDVNVPYASGGVEALENGAWWRHPQNGDPVKGGNFILSAHRFIMGLTPQQTQRKSPFYNINKLTVNDEFIVDYEGKRYTYVIKEIFAVKPDAIEIEAPTEDDRLTLYSCTLGGANDGREVFIAKLKTEPEKTNSKSSEI